MPYTSYGKMDKEDVYDIIAYIRSLPAIENQSGERELDFPMNFILNTIPKKAELSLKPDKSNPIEYGGYLVQIAACMDCHTEVNKGQIIPEMAFAGGRDFKMPNGLLRSANITPDLETGIGSWTEDMFVTHFKKYRDPLALPPIKEGEINTIMPWAMYAAMEETDLKAMFAYLHTLKPIKNNIVHFSN